MSSDSTMPFNWNEVPMPPLPASPVNTNVIKYFRTYNGDYYIAEWAKANDISVGDFIITSSEDEMGTVVDKRLVIKVAQVNYWLDGQKSPERKARFNWRLVETIYKKDVDEYLINEAAENNARIRWGANGMVYV